MVQFYGVKDSSLLIYFGTLVMFFPPLHLMIILAGFALIVSALMSWFVAGLVRLFSESSFHEMVELVWWNFGWHVFIILNFGCKCREQICRRRACVFQRIFPLLCGSLRSCGVRNDENAQKLVSETIDIFRFLSRFTTNFKCFRIPSTVSDHFHQSRPQAQSVCMVISGLRLLSSLPT